MRTGSIIRKFTASMMLIAAIFITAISVKGRAFAKESIDSEGNIVMDNGDMALYASDISFLEEEKDALFSELPVRPDTADALLDGAVRRGNIKSRGAIDYAGGQVVIDASDLTYLADEIDALEAAYKLNTVAALNRMGTYYLSDGSGITHDESAEILPVESAVNLSFDEIYEGVLQSQSVENLATTETLTGASADNLTAGTASWVDGELIVGNGADNDLSYEKGYNEGYNAGRTQGREDVMANPGGFGISTGISPEQLTMYSAREDFPETTTTLVVPHNGTCSVKFEIFAAYSKPANSNELTITVLRGAGAIAYETYDKDITSDTGPYRWNKTISISNCTKGEILIFKINKRGSDASWVVGIY